MASTFGRLARYIGMQRAALGVLILVAAGFAPASPVDVSGTYTSNWGQVTLHQRGTHVTGEYVYAHGQIDGVVDGNTVRYAWREDDGKGRGVFVLASDGELVGTWGVGDDDTTGGGWRLARTSTAGIAR